MDVMKRRLVPSNAVRAVAVDDALVLVDSNSGQYFGLNEVGSEIWRLLGEGKQGPDIVQALSHQYDAGAEAIGSDTLRILTELADAGLIK